MGKGLLRFQAWRWISGEGKLKHKPSFKFLAFNCRPRICFGKKIAFTETKITTAAIIFHFHIEAVQGRIVEPKLSMTMLVKNRLMVKLRKRESMEG